MLVAATGVGAGDLMTAGLAGSRLGVVVAWTAIVGAILKYALNEGVARWQMSTGTTLLEGWSDKLGTWIRWVFLAYLLIWSLVTGGALVSACGVAGYGLFTPTLDPETARIIWGVAHSLVGLTLVLAGGYRLFEKLMAICIGVMFVAVIATAVLIRPDWSAVGAGLIMPTIPKADNALNYVLGIIGGVGGTVTLLCYGYWIREEGRSGATGVRACRLDLAIGYTMTALFGVAMIVIGSRVSLTQGGARMAPVLAEQLAGVIGPAGRWVFLIGFWGAVFSSLLGVWQSVPYLFADFVYMKRLQTEADTESGQSIELTKTTAYRAFLVCLAIVPLVFLKLKVETIQLAYAVLGAFFMPLLALTLLIMNNRRAWVGDRFRSGWLINALLAATLIFFAVVGGQTLLESL
ncbi:MAG: Nramp family divalent metal transporter [Phycisphaerales bacterium]|nr:Nramp family divalent metal transporter [Phycisphaerales bacterium]MCB9856882.1 Nramp family divalent metal transporter [Phycisphaerales bacterium]MCB9861991.1 Nramp family divalent metal transporter [Phycisphaerales bacterium]